MSFRYDEFKLRPYQEDARDLMVDRGAVLVAITMGGGKTPTTLAAIEDLHDDDELDYVMVICPSGLKYQWLDQIQKFTTAKALVIDGDAKLRATLWDWAAKGRYRYVIVNPEMIMNDAKQLTRLRWDCVVIDEATAIKNPKSKRARLIKAIGKTVYFRYALTGQPVENKPEELFSIMEFVDKKVLGNPVIFDSTFIERDGYGNVIRYRNLDLLHRDMRKCMVRYSRADIKDYLPDVESSSIPVVLDRKAAKLYERIASDTVIEIAAALATFGSKFDVYHHYSGEDSAAAEVRGNIMAKLTALRMLCDHPQLIVDSAITYADEMAEKGKARHGSKYAYELYSSGALDGLTESPKVKIVVDTIEEILGEDPRNKVVLFSFFKGSLRYLEAEVKRRSLTGSVFYTGDMNAAKKDDAKRKFQQDPKTRLFLSSDAGGYGVDLPNANYLISFDLPWSAGKFDQREARIIRTSSEFDKVMVISAVVRGSIEQRQADMLEQKKAIGDAFVDGTYSEAADLDMDLGTLRDFLTNSTV
jgi:SNF2 family DNA or RNA helicase